MDKLYLLCYYSNVPDFGDGIVTYSNSPFELEDIKNLNKLWNELNGVEYDFIVKEITKTDLKVLINEMDRRVHLKEARRTKERIDRIQRESLQAANHKKLLNQFLE